MSKFFNKQRKQSNSLILGLFASILIHGSIALALSRRQWDAPLEGLVTLTLSLAIP